MNELADGTPEGSAYDWYRRALDLLARGDADASLLLLERVLVKDPTSRAALEARARALFDAARYAESSAAFQRCVDVSPDDDYAHYGLGLSLWRTQNFRQAEDHLAMACVMRPSRPDYTQALTQVRATLKARRTAGMPLNGPIDTPSLVGRSILGIDTFIAEYPELHDRSPDA